MTKKIPHKKDLVSTATIMAEFRGKSIPQREFLKKHNVRTALCEPNKRGYTHWITQEDAAALRDKLQAERDARHTPATPPAPTPAPQPQPDPAPQPTPTVATAAADISEEIRALIAGQAVLMKHAVAIVADVKVLLEERAADARQLDALALSIGRMITDLRDGISACTTSPATLTAVLEGVTLLDTRMSKLLNSLGEPA